MLGILSYRKIISILKIILLNVDSCVEKTIASCRLPALLGVYLKAEFGNYLKNRFERFKKKSVIKTDRLNIQSGHHHKKIYLVLVQMDLLVAPDYLV